MSYYFSNSPGEKIGPVSRNELLDLVKSGIVTETTLVSSAWRRRAAGRLSFLKSALSETSSAMMSRAPWSASSTEFTSFLRLYNLRLPLR